MFDVKFYSIISMCAHITCFIICGIKHKTVKDIKDKDKRETLFFFVPIFLILFPVMAIPLFWVITISRSDLTSLNLIFFILFALLIINAFLAICKSSFYY
ncbi:hypothetical protein C2G38_2107495 [Gigaspora rosea]|uniref:Uncharacterized protein n=1 Tax=Gigaspora rosea TaxID=44941 RepID=A0A397UK56_9GLOM|nr:hypothetical protein C2G38_2107495 [Gigaspora rosea]